MGSTRQSVRQSLGRFRLLENGEHRVDELCVVHALALLQLCHQFDVLDEASGIFRFHASVHCLLRRRAYLRDPIVQSVE